MDNRNPPRRVRHNWSYIVVGVAQGLLLTLLIFLLMV